MSDWTAVAKAGDIPEGEGRQVEVAGRRVAVFNTGDGWRAIGDVCTHIGASLAEGPVDAGSVMCPWHGARFDLETGQVLNGPAVADVPCYPVRVEGDDVLLGPPTGPGADSAGADADGD